MKNFAVIWLSALFILIIGIIFGGGMFETVDAGENFIVYLPYVKNSSVEVILANGRFTPHTLAVRPGTIVQWENNEVISHTLLGDGGWLPNLTLTPGEQFSWLMDTPGIYHFVSSFSSGIEGEILVLEGGTQTLFEGTPVEEAYLDYCSGCHGADRGGGIGPALIPDIMLEADSFYFDTIKNGRVGTIMPAWGSFGLTDEEIWMLVGFLRSEPNYEEIEWGMPQIAASRTVLVPEDQLPLAPTHNGNLDNLFLITEREARRIAVVDGDTHELLAHIDASYRAHGYAFDPTSDRWAYNLGRDGWVFKIDLYSLQAVTKVRVGHDSRGLAISDDGQYIIAGNYIPHTAVILDAQTLEPLKVLATEGTDPDGIFVQSRVAITSDVAPDLVGPYFILGLKEAGQVWRIDYSQPDFPIDKLENVGRILHDGFLSSDNTRFYIASQGDGYMAVINVENWTLVDTIATGEVPHPGSGAVWETGGVEYGATVHAGEGLVTVWNLADNEITAQIPTSGPGLFIRTHEANPYVWADTMSGPSPNEIYIIDKATLSVTHVITDGIQTLHPEFTQDGNYVYISDWLGNTVRVYDANTFALVAVIDDVITPTGIFNTARRYEKLGH